MAPRSKAAPPPAPETRDALAQAVTELSGQVETLSGLVDGLHQSMAVLTAAIDDIRQEFEYAVRNNRIGRGREQWRPTDIPSVPKGVRASDFGEQVNTNSAKNQPSDAASAANASRVSSSPQANEPEASRQRNLFD